jgi:hypothetical protein
MSILFERRRPGGSIATSYCVVTVVIIFSIALKWRPTGSR